MAFKSRLLYPAAIVLSAINVLGLPIAVVQSEPWHATLHATLALAFGFWALRMRHARARDLDRATEPGTLGGDAPSELGPGGGHGGFTDQWVREKPPARERRPEE